MTEHRPPQPAVRPASIASATRPLPTARPSSPAALLRQLGLRPRKGLSQSFLTDASVTRQIAAAASLDEHDDVLEVGPGLGILTQVLARQAGRVTAFELDRDLAAVLPRLVPENVTVVQGDALVLGGYTGTIIPMTNPGWDFSDPSVQTAKTVTIEVKGDGKREGDETFYLDLFGLSSNALFTKNRGVGTILNDD